jgi:hypothetical protein
LERNLGGLFINEWSNGISECNFTLDEILNEFTSRNIEIPESLLNDFLNKIHQKKIIRNQNELKRLNL